MTNSSSTKNQSDGNNDNSGSKNCNNIREEEKQTSLPIPQLTYSDNIDNSSKYLTVYVSKNLKDYLDRLYPRKLRPKYFWLLDTIFRSLTYNRENLRNGYASLSAEIIQDYLGPRYSGAIIRDLEKLECIERNGSWSTTMHRCMGYRLTKAASQDIEPFEIFAPTLAKKRQHFLQQCRGQHPYISDTLNRLSFRPEVRERVAQISDPGSRLLFDDVVKKHFYVIQDRETGRTFHPIANLPHRIPRLRDYLLIDHEQTVEVDVGCAQPALFATFYPAASEEKKRYAEAILTDAIYQSAMKQLGIDRDEAKKQFLIQCAFGAIQARESYPLFDVFVKDWPELGANITEMRWGLGKSKFARLMQRLEADIVIKKVLPDCQKAGLSVLPIHDAVLCKQSEAAKAQEIMTQHWCEALGFTPNVRVKPPQPLNDAAKCA